MSWYRCYFIDERGKTIGAHLDLEAPGDAAAVEEARRLCRAHSRCAGGEVWSDGRLVDQFDLNPGRRPSPAKPGRFWPL